MEKIIVTGGSGLIGSCLKNNLPKAIFISSSDYDLTNENEVIEMYKNHNPDRIIHLAAKVGGLIDNIELPIKYLDDNILMNTFLLKHSIKFNLKRYTCILSSCAYANSFKKNDLKEENLHDGLLDKNTFSYGLSKRVAAAQIDNYNKQHNTKYNYIIPCNLYGATDKISEKNAHFMTALINKIKLANHNNDKHIKLFGDGKPKRQFLYAKDFAKILKLMIERDITDSFNSSPKEVYTIKQIARIALRTTKNQDIKIIFDKTKPNGQLVKILNTQLFDKLFPTFEYTSLEQGIKEYYNSICLNN
jgi:GDP-L-fucose synthase